MFGYARGDGTGNREPRRCREEWELIVVASSDVKQRQRSSDLSDLSGFWPIPRNRAISPAKGLSDLSDLSDQPKGFKIQGHPIPGASQLKSIGA